MLVKLENMVLEKEGYFILVYNVFEIILIIDLEY